MGARRSDSHTDSAATARQIRALFERIPRRQRLSLAAQVLLDEADGCDQQLGILLKALARDENDGDLSLATDAVVECEPVSRAKLSPRKRETLKYLALGLSEKEIAPRMKLARQHVKGIYRAMRVHSRGELLSIVLRTSRVTSTRAD